jgi:predicted aspartyl protease
MRTIVPASAPKALMQSFLWVAALVAAAPPPFSAAIAGTRDVASVRAVTVPESISFREVDGAGFIIRVWVQGVGPFAFAIDTGAGCNIVSERVAREAKLAVGAGTVPIGGLSGSHSVARTASATNLAAGSRDNVLPSTSVLLVTDTLPSGVDGVLDPSIVYWPLGFEVDIPARRLRAFDPATSPVIATSVPDGGAVVAWMRVDGTARPFVSVGPGRTALLDTGSQFGLAITEGDLRAFGATLKDGGMTSAGVDLGGGSLRAQRATTPTLQVGQMLLKNVPTDVLEGPAHRRPVLLGRAALRPFRIAFDPRSRLIRFDPRAQ